MATTRRCEKPKAASRTWSRRRRPSAISTASAACSRTAATTSTTSAQSGDLRRGLLSAVAPAAAVARRARRPAVAAGGGAAAAGADHPADALACRRWTAWTRCGRLRRRWRTTTQKPTTRRRQAQYRKAVRLTAQTGTIVATWGRLQAGGGPIAPDPVLGHAANFLYMLTGNRPNALAVACVRRCADRCTPITS